MSGTVVVLATRGDTSTAVVDVLRDWSAAGMVDSFAWVDQEELYASAGLASVPATVVEDGKVRRETLGAHLADFRTLSTVRLVAFDAPGTLQATLAQAAANNLRDELGRTGWSVLLLHVIAGTEGLRASEAAWLAWQNLVLAPEDSWDARPNVYSEPLTPESGLTERTEHFATALLSIGGLWRGAGGSPFDAEPVAPGMSVRVTRSFVRGLDASAVSRAAYQQTVGFSGGLPRPRATGGERLPYLTDPQAAASSLVGQLVERHQALFSLEREAPPVLRPTDVSIGRAIGLFWSFLLAAVKGAPKAWAERLLSDVASGVAGRAQRILFGENESQYRVTVFSRDASGQLASVRALAERNQPVVAAVHTLVPNIDLTLPDTDPFWREFVAGALTLADGGAHGALAPVRQGADPGVVRDISVIVPSPTDAYLQTGALAARIHNQPIEPVDAFTARRVRRQLEDVASSDPALGAEASRALQDLRDWFRPHARSYAGQVGDKIASRVMDAAEDVDNNRRILEEAAGETGISGKIERAQSRLAKKQRFFLLGFLGAILVIVALLLLSVVAPVVAAILGLLSLLGWFSGAFLTFFRGQQELFRLMNSREQDAKNAEIAVVNLGHAVADLNRLTILYGQFLQWSSVLGTFLQAPLGRPVLAKRDLVRISRWTNRAAQFAVADADETKIAVALERVSSDLFAPGWLGPVWDQLLAGAPERLGPRGVELAANPAVLFGDPCVDDDAPLRLWAASLREAGVDEALGEDLWRRARSRIVRDSGQLTDTLLTDVRVVGANATAMLSAADFLGAVAAGSDPRQDRAFRLDLFGPEARGRNAHLVNDSYLMSTAGAAPAESRSENVHYAGIPDVGDGGLDQLVLLVQCTAPLAPGDLQWQRVSDAAQAGSGTTAQQPPRMDEGPGI